MVHQLFTPVLSNEKFQENVFKLTLSSSLISKRAKPGNFVHIRVGSKDSPLLRRAFSVHSLEKRKNRFEIFFKVVGKGTEILSKKSLGDTLDILGPIGNCFSLPKKGKEILLVAGGMGMAPLWFLFTHLIRGFHQEVSEKVAEGGQAGCPTYEESIIYTPVGRAPRTAKGLFRSSEKNKLTFFLGAKTTKEL